MATHARRVASHLGTKHSEMMLEPRMLWELVPDVARFLDEPMADASLLPTYLVPLIVLSHLRIFGWLRETNAAL